MTMLACIAPTRILVLLNALTDKDVRAEAELADISDDIAIEVAAAISPSAVAAMATATGQAPPTEAVGRLLAIRIPRPQLPDEPVDPDLIHRQQRRDVAFNSGLLLEDGGAAPSAKDAPPSDAAADGAAKAPPAGENDLNAALAAAAPGDRWRYMPRDAKDFFYRVIRHEYAAAGLAAGIAPVAPSAAASSTRGATAPVGLLTDGTPPESQSGSWERGSTAIVVVGSVAPAPLPERADLSGYDPLAGRTKGLGKIFLEFTTAAAAVAAQRELSGRAFNGRILVTTFADEDAYRAGEVCDFEACRKPAAPSAVVAARQQADATALVVSAAQHAA